MSLTLVVGGVIVIVCRVVDVTVLLECGVRLDAGGGRRHSWCAAAAQRLQLCALLLLVQQLLLVHLLHVLLEVLLL